MPSVSLVRCPRCGATDAGEDGEFYELALMRCRSCGYTEYCDSYEGANRWNAEVDLPSDATQLPAKLPPLLVGADAPVDLAEIPGACDDCRASACQQTIRPYSARQDLFEVVRGLREDIWRCKACITCYQHYTEPAFSVDNQDDVLTRIDPATSVALLGVSSGDLTAEWLDALAAAPRFSRTTLLRAMPEAHPLRTRLLTAGPQARKRASRR